MLQQAHVTVGTYYSNTCYSRYVTVSTRYCHYNLQLVYIYISKYVRVLRIQLKGIYYLRIYRCTAVGKMGLLTLNEKHRWKKPPTHLASCVHVSAWVANGNSADDLAMIERVDLAGVSGDPGPNKCIGRKRNWLHLSISTHMEGVGPETIWWK